MAFNAFVPSTCASDHLPTPPVGLIDVAAPPKVSPATHNDTDGQEITSAMASAELGSTTLHADRPPVGLVELRMASQPATTHNDTEGHETVAIPPIPGSTWTRLQAVAPPVGLVELSTLPASSTATHSETAGHAMLSSTALPMGLLALSTCATRHALVPPVGSVELSTLPFASTPTHSDTDGHETAFGSFAPPTRVTRHVAAPPVDLSRRSPVQRRCRHRPRRTATPMGTTRP